MREQKTEMLMEVREKGPGPGATGGRPWRPRVRLMGAISVVAQCRPAQAQGRGDRQRGGGAALSSPGGAGSREGEFRTRDMTCTQAPRREARRPGDSVREGGGPPRRSESGGWRGPPGRGA